MNENIVLWGVTASPYVRKVMIALGEKELSYQLNETLPVVLLQALNQPIADEFVHASPLGKIPALQVGDFTVADSAVIAGYLDAKFTSGHALYPTNAEEAALAQWFERYSDTVLTQVIYQKIFMQRVIVAHILQQEADDDLVNEAIQQELPPLLSYLDHALQGKTWFAGDAFSMADVAVFTQLLALQMAEENFDLSPWTNLSRLLQQMSERKSVQLAGIL